ncbi:MAG: acyl-CoA dehydrogenase family protein [Polyangiaceae bacterium]|nr:acyl-CoA dehydrogenase family protein [Polyangiaceae bacterium]
MNFDITEDQLRTQQVARDFAAHVLAPRATDVDQNARIEAESIGQLGDAGWLGMTIPEAFGGSGGDFVALALAIEEFAAACANSAGFVAANVALACRPLLAYGSDTQKRELLTPLARGKTTLAFAPADPDNLGAGVVHAERQHDGSFVLRGETSPVTLFGQPDHVLVFARTADERVTAFVVPYGAANLHVTVLPGHLGKRAARLGVLRFDGVQLPASAAVGQQGDGLSIARSALDDARIAAAAEALGIARAAYEKAALHVKQESPKTPAPGLLGVQVMLADMCVEVEAARLLTLRAARQADAGTTSGSERSMAKLFASEMSTRVAHKAMQILGARNVATTPSLERHFRDARMAELSDDPPEVQRAIIAAAMLKA